jgi:hypothetical protein
MSYSESSHPERETLLTGEGCSVSTERQGTDIALTISQLTPNAFNTTTVWLSAELARALADHLLRIAAMP